MSQNQAAEQVFGDESAVVGLMRSHDWAQTPLGAIETWSEELKTAVQRRLTQLNQTQTTQVQQVSPASQNVTETALSQTAVADAFRVTLSDALRLLTDANEIQATAARILGESLGASRVIYIEVLPGDDEVIVHKNYTHGVAELTGRYRLEDFGRNLTQDHRLGRSTIVPDVANSFRYSDSEKARYQAIDIAAHLDIPLIKNERFVALLAVHQATPREWTDFETKRVEETAAQTWAAVERARTEAALRESEDRLGLALKTGKLGSWQLDLKTNHLLASDQCKANYGFSPEFDFTHQALFDRIHPDDRAWVQAAVEQAIEQHTDYDVEYRTLWDDDSLHWALVRGHTVYDDDDTPLHMVGMSLDITERKQAETALRQTSAELERQLRKFDALTASIPDFIYTFDLSGRFTYISQSLLNLWQKTLAEAMGKNFFELEYPIELAARLQNQIQQVIETHQSLKDETPYTSGLGTRAYEYILVPLFDATGTVEAVAGVTRDITDRKQAEATVQASNERLKLLSTIANDLLLNEDPKAFLASLFAQVSTHLGLEVYFNYLFEADQQRLQLYTYGGISDETAEAAKVLALGQGVCGYAVQHRQPAVVEAALESDHALALPLQSIGLRAYASHPLIVGDHVLGTLGLGTRQRDRFTHDELDLMQVVAHQVAVALERSRLVAALEARAAALTQINRIKDEFLAVLSHELRTPLNPILGWSRLLQQGKLNAEKTLTALATIERNAQLQSQLIEDLLDISRILQGKMSLSALPVDLSIVIAAALETVQLSADSKKIQVQTLISSAVIEVVGDAGRLQQVVWNLLSNAIKFTPQGGQVTLTLSGTETHAQLQITDTGKGICADFLPHVFEHFRQEDGATTRKFGGLGLGLAIARQIVELHGGTIAVDSPGEEQGATFTVQIPLAGRSNVLPAIDLPSDASGDLSGIHILVVDDEADSREFVAFVLEQAGAIVIAVSSGILALEAFPQAAPDIIVSDIGMPEMDGYMLMRQIRAHLESQQIPALALTAYAGEVDQQQAIAAGFQKHLSKPVEPEAIVQTILALCNSEKNDCRRMD